LYGFGADVLTRTVVDLAAWLLSHFQYRDDSASRLQLDFGRNEITFFDAGHFSYSGNGDAIPLYLHTSGNGIDVDATVDGIKGRFLVNSGNEIGTFLSSTFVTQNDLVKKLDAKYRGYNGRGFGGDSPPAWYVRCTAFSHCPSSSGASR
jgi:hypothetical protein